MVLAALCLAAFAAPSSAQVFTGRIDVVAKDATGAILPGVTVELTGPQTARSVTDTQGEAHFLNLAPGRYTVTATLSGFRDYKNDNVPVGAGSVISLDVAMAVGGVTEAVTVQSETPVIQTKRQTVSTNVTLDELQNIPSSRDPWVVLQTVPGIIVDRVNVGGAESGQQSNYQAKGASDDDNTWNMDGVSITDMAALGSSPTYYDFDMFQEIQVTTGGADPANGTPGVQLNFVLRSGTNNWRASSRFYYENNDLQSDNVSDELFGSLQSFNRIEFYKDYGAEGGGPILRDKLFVWGAYGKTNPATEIYTFRAQPATGSLGPVFRTDPGCKGAAQAYAAIPDDYNITARDCTTLENFSFKGTGNISTNLRANFTYFRGDKLKNGRGASATRPAPSTHNQTGPTDMYKAEVNYTLNDRTFLTARYAYTGGGFSLEPVGGRDAQPFYDDGADVYGNSYWFYVTDRPQNNFQIEGNHFRGNHEFKFGFGYRKASVASQSGYPGGVLNIYDDIENSDVVLAQFTRDFAAKGNTDYWSAFLGDQITRGRLTVNLGVRWDRQVSNLEEASVAANPFNDFILAQTGLDYLGALTASPQKAVTTWNSITPRVGITYALDAQSKTIARASYAMFASQLLATRGFTVSPIPGTPTGSGYVYWEANDLNRDARITVDELVPGGFVDQLGLDPSNPLGGNPDRIGDYKVPLTHELLFGVEREVARNFGISANVTWRHLNNFNWLQFDGVDASDYVEIGRLTGTADPIGAFDIPLYAVNEDAVPSNFGRVYEHRDGYYQRYLGFEVSATKRMADNWMLRAGFSTNRHTEHFSGPEAMADPTPTLPLAATPLASPNVDGGPVVTQTAGSGKGNIFMVLPRYQFLLTGAYQAKWGINLGLNYVMREGYATPYYASDILEDGEDILAGTGKNVLLSTDVDQFRLPAVHSVDARVSKMFAVDRVNLHVDFDAFNLLNSSTVLVRQIDFSSSSFDAPREIMNPRIFRFGVRVQF
jgi:hypothetical protein